MITYQWVKFRPDAEFQSTDFDLALWHLVEIDDEWPDGGVTLFGVEYTVGQSDIAELGPVVENPNDTDKER